MTYARVAHDAVPGKMVIRPRDEGVDAFLLEHVRKLLALGQGENPQSAEFREADIVAEFARLRDGGEPEFLEAATALTQRLIAQMDGRSGAGLLVCLRTDDDGELSVAALKLQVETQNAALLSRLDTGEEVLSAVKNVLDAPGRLQKGLVVPSARMAGGDVIVTDKLPEDALYFLNAFGVTSSERPQRSATALVRALSKQIGSEAAGRVAHALPSVQSGPLDSVLESLANAEPTLTVEVRKQTVAMLGQERRRVREVRTDAPVREEISADGISVRGPVAEMRKVSVAEQPDGKWQIVIEVHEEPRRRYLS